MLRRLFTFVSAVSLLLWAATCVLWVRNVSVEDRLMYVTPRWLVTAHAHRGRLTVDGHFPGRVAYVLHFGLRHASAANPPGPASMIDDRFALSFLPDGRFSATMPDWALAAAFAVAPCLWAWRHLAGRRRRRHALGQCPGCGKGPAANPAETRQTCGT